MTVSVKTFCYQAVRLVIMTSHQRLEQSRWNLPPTDELVRF